MSARPKRGERRARSMLAKLDDTGVVAIPGLDHDGGWGLRFPGKDQHTDAQREVAVHALLFGVAYPRCFGTMIRLLRERGAGQ